MTDAVPFNDIVPFNDALVFRALADDTRRALLDALFVRDGQTVVALGLMSSTATCGKWGAGSLPASAFFAHTHCAPQLVRAHGSCWLGSTHSLPTLRPASSPRWQSTVRRSPAHPHNGCGLCRRRTFRWHPPRAATS